MSRCAALALALLAVAASAAPAPAPRAFVLALPEEEAPIAVHGVVSFDGAGTGNGGMLYPAPTPGIGLLAVFTHGAIVSGMKKGQKTKLQEQADLVLEPFRASLDGIKGAALMREALAALPSGSALEHGATADDGALVVESLPLFAITKDQRTLIVEDAIEMRVAGKAHRKDAPLYQNVVRIVSAPRQGDEPAAAWNADGALRAEYVRMYAETLTLAFADLDADPAAAVLPFQTVRYLEGDAERIERARPVSGGCERVVLRNLRGWLMSVPVRSGSVAAVLAQSTGCGGLPAPAPARAAGATPP